MQNTHTLFGAELTILAAADSTSGRYDLIEGAFPPGTRTPLHRHSKYQEQIYVVSGQFLVRVGERIATLTPGQNIVIPPGVAHAVAAAGKTDARALLIASPSGFARLVAAAPGMRRIGLESEPLSIELMQRIAAEIGDEMIPDSPAP